MEEAAPTSKSRIAVPKAVREALGLVPGDRIRFVPAWQAYRLVVIKGDAARCAVLSKAGAARPSRSRR